MNSIIKSGLYDCLEKLNHHLPYLLIAGTLNFNNLSLIFIPVFISIGISILENLYNRFFNKNTLIIYSKKSGNSEYEKTSNSFYFELAKFIKQNYTNKNYNIESDSSYVENDKLPIYTPNYLLNVDFDYTMPSGNKINISSIKERVKDSSRNGFILTAKKREYIDEFIELVKNFQINDIRGVDQIATYNKSSNYDYGVFKLSTIYINKTFDNIFLKESEENLLKSSLTNFLKSENHYKELGIPYKKGFILYGIPGTGKSSTIYAIAKYTKRNIYKLDMCHTMTPSELRNQLNCIPTNCILVMEDVDANSIFHKRDTKKTTEVKIKEKDYCMKPEANITMDMILEILDGYNYLHGCILIFTTNHIDIIDEAIIRPGRIDHQIEYTDIDMYQLNNMLNFFYKSKEILNEDMKEALIKKGITTSKIINTYIMPNLEDKNNFIKLINDYIQSNNTLTNRNDIIKVEVELKNNKTAIRRSTRLNKK